MNAVSTTAATDLNELKRNSIAREYKFQLLSFMQEFETLETYKSQKDALKRRAEYCTELLDILDTRSAVEVIEDVKSENEHINDRIKEQQLVLKYKVKYLMRAVELLKEIGIEATSPALEIAKQFINV
jgi:hypothetical protein